MRTRIASLLFVVFVCSSLFGCGDSTEDFVITNAVAPVAVNDAFSSSQNIVASQLLDENTGDPIPGLLANDAASDGTVTGFQANSAQGGTVSVESDGNFTYTAAFGFKGVDTFTYTITNDSGQSTGTVTITVTGNGVFFDPTAGAGGNGTQGSPFNTLNDALAAAQDGDTVFVTGTAATTIAGAIVIPDGVSVVAQTSQIQPRQTEARFQETETPALITLSGDVSMGGGSGLSGFEVQGDLTAEAGTEEVTELNRGSTDSEVRAQRTIRMLSVYLTNSRLSNVDIRSDNARIVNCGISVTRTFRIESAGSASYKLFNNQVVVSPGRTALTLLLKEGGKVTLRDNRFSTDFAGFPMQTAIKLTIEDRLRFARLDLTNNSIEEAMTGFEFEVADQSTLTVNDLNTTTFTKVTTNTTKTGNGTVNGI